MTKPDDLPSLAACLEEDTADETRAHTTAGETPTGTARTTVDLVEGMRAVLHRSPPDQIYGQARAMLDAAMSVLREQAGDDHSLQVLRQGMEAIRPSSAPPTFPVPQTPAHLADLVLMNLRGTPQVDAHERARAVIVGAAAYLHESYGASYAAPVIESLMVHATEHGSFVRGGRPSGAALH